MNIKKSYLTALLITSVFITGCATQETKPEALQDLISKQSEMQEDERIASNAGIELNELRELVNNANKAWQDGEQEEFEQQMYLASRQSEIAESKGLAAHYRDQIEEMSEQRQQLLLQAKNAELERTRSRLEETQSELTTTSQQLEDLSEIAESAEQQAIALADELTNVKAEMTNRGMVLTLQDILFETAESDLKSGSERTIDKVTEFLNNNPDVVVTVEGFTDSVGSEAYNMGLSKQRAESVKSALTDQGIDDKRLTTKAMGEAFPVATNDTPAGRQENRRVELVLKQDKQQQ